MQAGGDWCMGGPVSLLQEGGPAAVLCRVSGPPGEGMTGTHRGQTGRSVGMWGAVGVTLASEGPRC